jgi:hypothetical protein
MLYRVVKVTSEEEGHGGMELLEVGPQARGWKSRKVANNGKSLGSAY